MYELIDPDCRPIVFKNGGFYGVTDVLAHMPEQPTFWETLFYVREGVRLRPRRSDDTLIAVIRYGDVVVNVPFEDVFKT